MIQPINYSTEVQSPFQAALQGYQAGAAIRADVNQQQQQQAAAEQQRRMQQDFVALGSNPTPQAIASLSVRYPQFSEQFKRSYDMLTETQRQSKLSAAIPIYAAIQSGRPDVASQQLEDQAAAYENSGMTAEANQSRAMAKLVKDHPEFANKSFGLLLSSVIGPEKFAENFGKLGGERRADELQPAAVAKAGADAQTAIVGAKFAESKAVADLQLNEAQIKKMAADTEISRMNARIAEMNAATSREANDLKRQELQLKVSEAVRERDEKLRAKVADVASARSTIDNFLNTADRVLKTDPEVIQQATGTVDSRIPTFRQATADLESLVETLSSQAFLSQIPSMKGTGSLTEREGDKLQASLANLSLRQTRPQLIANIKEAQRLMLKARQNLADRYGVPNTIPDRPALPAKAVPGMPKGFEVIGVE